MERKKKKKKELSVNSWNALYSFVLFLNWAKSAKMNPFTMTTHDDKHFVSLNMVMGLHEQKINVFVLIFPSLVLNISN
jgi:hypothetical protein